MEEEIAELEEQLEQAKAEMGNPEIMSNHEQAKLVLATFEETQSKLELLYEHWEEAAELQ